MAHGCPPLLFVCCEMWGHAISGSGCQSSAASIASAYNDRRTRARNIFILRCGTKDHVLLVPQSRQRINSGRSPGRRIASENRGA
jgi:hypothetical protein